MKDALSQLVAGKIPYLFVGADHFPDKIIFIPGSFNPLHKGHEGLRLAAEKISGRNGVFELSATNVDKAFLSLAEIEHRLLKMKGIYSIVLTCAPTFAEKAELFPGAWFALGYDTAVRLLSSVYHDDVPKMLARFQELGTRFVVAGRLHEDAFKGLESIKIPVGFEELFIPIPESVFREDISSTELRARQV